MVYQSQQTSKSWAPLPTKKPTTSQPQTIIPKTTKKMTTTKAAPKTTTAQTTTTVTTIQVPLSTLKTTLNRALKLRFYYALI